MYTYQIIMVCNLNTYGFIYQVSLKKAGKIEREEDSMTAYVGNTGLGTG